jgi:hypothetical protein
MDKVKYRCPATPCRYQGGEDISLLSFLTSVLDGVSGQSHTPAALNLQARVPDTHWIGRWVSLRADLDTEARRKILCLCRGSNPGRPVCSQTLY